MARARGDSESKKWMPWDGQGGGMKLLCLIFAAGNSHPRKEAKTEKRFARDEIRVRVVGGWIFW